MTALAYSPTARLAPPVGIRLVMVTRGLERGYARARTLEDLGYRISVCGEPGGAVEFARDAGADAIVVDLGREQAAAPDLICALRRATSGPIVVVGSRGDSAELIQSFEAGADEFCGPRTPTPEIDYRIRALLRAMRRSGEFQPEDDVRSALRIGDLEIDAESQLVKKRGQVVQLSPTEFRLLVTLAENAGRVVPSRALIARVWGDQYAGENQYLRLYVRYLRQKIEDDPSNPLYIVNRWGSGYALEGPPRAA